MYFDQDQFHIGVSYDNTDLECTCLCTKASCNLVSRVDKDCEIHSNLHSRSIRQSHPAVYCIGMRSHEDFYVDPNGFEERDSKSLSVFHKNSHYSYDMQWIGNID